VREVRLKLLYTTTTFKQLIGVVTQEMILVGAIFLALFASAHASFESLNEKGLIPSDGFHDLLGLVPFWMAERSVGLQRTLGTKKDDLPTSWNDIASQTPGSKVYDIAGSCSLQGTFSSEKAILKTKSEDGCTNPSLKVIFTKLFPEVQNC